MRGFAPTRYRMRGRALVASRPRKHLLQLLRERPCLTAGDAARELAVDPSTALYHLRLLAREGLAVVEGRHYFAAGATDADERARVVALQHAAPILDELRARPGATKTGLADALAIARPTLSLHVARLEQAGLVRTVREGRSVRVFPKETLS